MTDVVQSTEVVIREATTPATVTDLIRLALEKGISVEALQGLQALHERVSDRAAAAEFAAAMARFQAEVGPILTNKTAHITSQRTGGGHSYKFVDLDHLTRTCRPHLIRNQLTITWDTEVLGPTMLNVICTCRHVNGQFRTAAFPCPTESPAGMTAPQKFAAALTFARRYSMIQVLGLTTTEEDTDAADPSPITDDQAADLEALIQEKGISLNRFLKWAGVEKVADIRAGAYADCVRKVQEAKRPA